MGKIPVVFIVIILVCSAIAAILMINPGIFPGIQGENITSLTPVEVREYQGERLSSVADFRENSIRGTPVYQPIDLHAGDKRPRFTPSLPLV